MVQVLAQAPGRRRVQPKSAARLKAGLFSGPPSFLLNAAAHVDLAHVAASTLTGGVYGALDSSTLGVIFPNTAGQGWVFSAAPITGTEHTILVVANPRAQGSQRNCAVCQRTGAGPFAQVAFNAVAGSLGAIDISSGAFSYQSYDGVNNDGAYITGVANGSNRAFLVSRRGTSYVFSVDGATQTPTVNFSSNASAPTTGVEFKIGDLASYSGTGYGMQDGIALVLVLPFAITQELANKVTRDVWGILGGAVPPLPWLAQTVANTYLQALTATALSVVATISKARALLRTVSASSTVSATRSRRMSFVRSASSALSATKSRALSFTRSASSALSATVSKIRALKRTITSTAVSLAATLTKTKAVTQAVSTTGSLSAALVRQFGRVRSATASMTATRILVLQRIRLASSTVTATLSRIRALKRTITATAMTISATLSRVRSLMLTVSASAALSASRSRVVNLIRSASAGTTASMVRVRVTLRTITASVSLAATRVRRLGRIRSATAGSSATLSKLRTLGKTITASVSTSATIRRSVKLIVSGAQHITALVSRGTRGIIDITVGVTIQPTLARIRALKRTVTAITTWAATVRKAVRMTRTAVVAVVATRLRRFPYHVTTAVTTVVARIQPARVRVLTATTTLVATITTTLAQIGRLFARIAIRPAVGALRSLKAAVSGKPRIDDDH